MEFIDVLNSFMNMSKLTAKECIEYHPIIKAAVYEVEQRLKSGVDKIKHNDILSELCAAIAYYRYNILLNTQNSDIDIADIKVKINSSKEISSARHYKNELTALAKDLLDDNNLTFGENE